jgi:hypothetical protein
MVDLPPKPSPVEHFKQVAIRSYNKIVTDQFADLDSDELSPEIRASRAELKQACLIESTDSSILINNRMTMFYMVMRQAADLQAPLYGVPVGQFHETRRFRPQVCLTFREDPEDVDGDYRPLYAQIKFRLMGETETSITKTELTTLANKIKTEFGTGSGYRWHKGKTLCCYYDDERGYALHVYAYSATEGKAVISKVLDLQGHTLDGGNLTINEKDDPSAAFPTIPEQKTILGELTRMPRRRPVGYVRFQRATCAIWGKPEPVALYDRTGYLVNPLVRE